MAWNEPGGSGDKDPWGGNRGGNQGPPDLDELFKNLQRKFSALFGGKGGKGRGNGGSSFGFNGTIGIGIVVLILLLFWGATGFYKVQQAERGIILRFGKYVETTQTGLHWHLPAPIEKVTLVNINEVHTVPLRATMLTQDENIVDIEGSVQYQITNATDFLFNDRAPVRALEQAAESAIRQSIGRAKMDYVITDGRAQIAIQVKDIIQKIINSYGTGITVLKMNIQHARPPEAVKDAFDDVTQAREDMARLKDEAQTYSNGVIPKARGNAARIREEADAYKSEVVNNAEGEGKRFTQLLTAYKKSPAVTRERLYLDMMQSVLTRSSKILIDVSGSNNLLYLPLDKLMSHQSGDALLPGSLKKLPNQQDLLRQSARHNSRLRANDLRSRGTR